MEKPKETDIIAGEVRQLRHAVNELSLELRANSWGYAMRDNINAIRSALAAVPMMAKLIFIVGMSLLSGAYFVVDKKLKTELAMLGGNFIIAAVVTAGGM
jgi:hypothetical protein